MPKQQYPTTKQTFEQFIKRQKLSTFSVNSSWAWCFFIEASGYVQNWRASVWACKKPKRPSRKRLVASKSQPNGHHKGPNPRKNQRIQSDDQRKHHQLLNPDRKHPKLARRSAKHANYSANCASTKNTWRIYWNIRIWSGLTPVRKIYPPSPRTLWDF